GISPSDVILSRSGDYLVIEIANTTDKITVSHYFGSVKQWQTEEIRFADSTVWTQEDVDGFIGE
ncbi:MAG: hypothetical protein GY754_19895, partial [bacterium]|nr:hypothetical protein [bacterium]